jgi:hypothetical protein
MSRTKPEAIQQQIFSTFFSLRVGTGIIGVLFPIVLGLGGWLHAGIQLQNSLSAYYYALGPGGLSMRDWFVGGLFALGACLYLYKGFSLRENLALNTAGVFAVSIAVNPMHWPEGTGPKIDVHGVSATLFFLAIAYVAVFCGDETLCAIHDLRIRARYRKTYALLAFLMVASPLSVVVMNWFHKDNRYVLMLEVAGIYAFAAFWFTKTRELRFSAADRKALNGELGRDDATPGHDKAA